MPLKFSSLKSWLIRFSGRNLAKPYIESHFVDSVGTPWEKIVGRLLLLFPFFPPGRKKCSGVDGRGFFHYFLHHTCWWWREGKNDFHTFSPQRSPVFRMRTTKFRFTRNWLLSWALVWIYPHRLTNQCTNLPFSYILGNYVKRQCPKLVKIKTI